MQHPLEYLVDLLALNLKCPDQHSICKGNLHPSDKIRDSIESTDSPILYRHWGL